MPRKCEGQADRKSMEQNAEQGGKSRHHFLSSSQAMEAEGGGADRREVICTFPVTLLPPLQLMSHDGNMMPLFLFFTCQRTNSHPPSGSPYQMGFDWRPLMPVSITLYPPSISLATWSLLGLAVLGMAE